MASAGTASRAAGAARRGQDMRWSLLHMSATRSGRCAHCRVRCCRAAALLSPAHIGRRDFRTLGAKLAAPPEKIFFF